jgi:hypothetical protein
MAAENLKKRKKEAVFESVEKIEKDFNFPSLIPKLQHVLKGSLFSQQTNNQ